MLIPKLGALSKPSRPTLKSFRSTGYNVYIDDNKRLHEGH